MELAFLLRSVGAEVCWITIQKPPESDEVIYSLDHKMLDRGVQVIYLLAYIFDLLSCLLSFWPDAYQIPANPSPLEPKFLVGEYFFLIFYDRGSSLPSVPGLIFRVLLFRPKCCCGFLKENLLVVCVLNFSLYMVNMQCWC